MTIFYRAGFQLLKVRIWLLLSLVAAAGFCWWGWDLLLTLGLRPADGGVLQPFLVRFLVGGFLAAIGIGFAYGMWLYSRRYVTSLGYDPDTDMLIVRTPLFLGSRTQRFARKAIKGTSFNRGYFEDPLGAMTVDAPWHALEIKGYRSWFIIDAQGRWLDLELAGQVLNRPATARRSTDAGPTPASRRQPRGKPR